jgi:hypothetical protein
LTGRQVIVVCSAAAGDSIDKLNIAVTAQNMTSPTRQLRSAPVQLESRDGIKALPHRSEAPTHDLLRS